MGARLVSNKFGQRAMEDAFLNQIVFDDENKCYAVTEVDGMEVFSDITQGMRMAQKSGMTERDGLDVLLAKCGNCTKELTVGGDKVILYSRNGPEGKAVYWCKACRKLEHQAIEGKPLSNTNFKKLSAEASGRPFMTAGGVAGSALYKLARDSFGDGSQASVDKMRSRPGRSCLEEVQGVRGRGGRKLHQRQGTLGARRYPRLQPDDLEDVRDEIRLQAERLRLHPTLGDGLDHRDATQNGARVLVLRGLRRQVPLQTECGWRRFTRPRQALPARHLHADPVGRRNYEDDVRRGGGANTSAEGGNPRPQRHHGRERPLGTSWGEGGLDRFGD